MRHGAFHYISKDFDFEGVRGLVANASEQPLIACQEAREDWTSHLVAHPRRGEQGFQCCWARGLKTEQGMTLEPAVARVLSLSVGDSFWDVEV